MTATRLEQVILVDEQNREIGVAEKLSAHQQKLLHRAFSTFIFREITSSKWELLLQQRGLNKYHSGGLWTNTCCSHPRSNETVIAAGERRLQEEFGILVKLNDLGWFKYNAHFSNGLSENEIDHVLVGIVPVDIEVKPNPEEIHAYRWITVDALQEELATHPDQFTPWFAKALQVARASL
jgi:isopentenyl-diphosphate delta-isomerase type 1